MYIHFKTNKNLIGYDTWTVIQQYPKPFGFFIKRNENDTI